MKTTHKKMVEQKMSDAEFSNYLFRNGWDGDVEKNRKTETSWFLDPKGRIIATVIYNNRESTHRIFLPVTIQD